MVAGANSCNGNGLLIQMNSIKYGTLKVAYKP